jgi:hypothetical protein
MVDEIMIDGKWPCRRKVEKKNQRNSTGMKILARKKLKNVRYLNGKYYNGYFNLTIVSFLISFVLKATVFKFCNYALILFDCSKLSETLWDCAVVIYKVYVTD